jgi:hypothetical protein
MTTNKTIQECMRLLGKKEFNSTYEFDVFLEECLVKVYEEGKAEQKNFDKNVI